MEEKLSSSVCQIYHEIIDGYSNERNYEMFGNLDNIFRQEVLWGVVHFAVLLLDKDLSFGREC